MSLLDLSLPKDEKTNPNRQSNLPSTWAIFRDFLHLGLTAYGGLAMVEPIRRRVVRENGWLTQKEFMDGLALCQIVPGATVVQLATYVGYRLQKTLGAVGRHRLYFTCLFSHVGPVLPLLSIRPALLVKSVSPGIKCRCHCPLGPGSLASGRKVRQHWLDFGIALVHLGPSGSGCIC